MADSLTFLDFAALIDRSLEDPGAITELERRYLARVAILVIDFTGMVKRTEAAGIIYALALSRAAMKSMEPALTARSGQVIKQVADTFFAIFPGPEDALLGALDAQAHLAAFNAGRADAISASMGLGYGDSLLLPGEDVFGAEVSRAFVLGEDVADCVAFALSRPAHVSIDSMLVMPTDQASPKRVHRGG